MSLVLTENLSSHCTDIDAALRWTCLDCVLWLLLFFYSSGAFFSLRCSLLRSLKGQTKQPVSGEAMGPMWHISASFFYQEGSFRNRCSDPEVACGPQSPTLTAHRIPLFDAALVRMQSWQCISHNDPAKNPQIVRLDKIGPWFLAS